MLRSLAPRYRCRSPAFDEVDAVDEGIELLKVEHNDSIAEELGHNLQVSDH